MSADMPDASASRKRQIQITSRTFRVAGASRAFPHERLISGIARLAACSRALWVSVTRKTAQQSVRRDARPDLGGEFSPCGCLMRFRNRVKLIRCRRRPDSIPQITVPDRGARGRAFATLYKCPPIPRKIGLSSPFAGFLALVGRPSTVRHPLPPARRMR